MTDEEEFLARLTYTQVTALELWRSNNDTLFSRHNGFPAVAITDIYVTDLKLLLPTGAYFMFMARSDSKTGIKRLYDK